MEVHHASSSSGEVTIPLRNLDDSHVNRTSESGLPSSSSSKCITPPLLPSYLLQHILPYLQPHLPARLVSRSWDDAIQHIHALDICTKCRAQCKPHNVVQRRQRIPWNNRWIIRGRYDEELRAVTSNPHLFEAVKALTIAFHPEKFTFAEGQLSALLSTLGPSASITQLVFERTHLSDHDVSVLAHCPHLSLLTGLAFHCSAENASTFRTIASSPHFSSLEQLRMGMTFAYKSVDEGAEEASILSSSPTLANLKVLELFCFPLGQAAASIFAHSSSLLTNLVSLPAFAIYNKDALAPLIASSFGFRMEYLLLQHDEFVPMYLENAVSVKELEISYIPQSAVESLLSSSRLSTVTSLSVEQVQNFSLEKLVTCQSLHQLKKLTFYDVPIVSEQDVIRGLSSSRYQLTRLKELTISGMAPKSLLINHISSCPRFSTLVSLELQYAGLDDKDLVALCASPHFQYLQTLVLSWNSTGVNDSGWQALGTCRNFPNLISLDLNGNRSIGVAGCGHFKDISLYFTSLATLLLSDCGFSDECIAALTENSHLQSIRSLDLSKNGTTFQGFNTVGCCTSLVGLQDLVICEGSKSGNAAANQAGEQQKLFENSCLTNLTRLSTARWFRIPFSTIEEFVLSSPIMKNLRVLEMSIAREVMDEADRSRYDRLLSILDERLEQFQDY